MPEWLQWQERERERGWCLDEHARREGRRRVGCWLHSGDSGAADGGGAEQNAEVNCTYYGHAERDGEGEQRMRLRLSGTRLPFQTLC